MVSGFPASTTCPAGLAGGVVVEQATNTNTNASHRWRGLDALGELDMKPEHTMARATPAPIAALAQMRINERRMGSFPTNCLDFEALLADLVDIADPQPKLTGGLDVLRRAPRLLQRS
jgi:hypothetical protein